MFSFFKEISIVFSIVAVPNYIPTNSLTTYLIPWPGNKTHMHGKQLVSKIAAESVGALGRLVSKSSRLSEPLGVGIPAARAAFSSMWFIAT